MNAMKTQFVTLLATVLFHCAFAQEMARVESVKIQSEVLQQEREILIYTPEDYNWRTQEYFNVIYVFDSQSREFFDYTTSIVSFLTNGSKSFIVVGITSPYNEKLDYSRRNDFLPNLESEAYKKQAGRYYGNADNFLRFVESEVITYVNAKYRTLNQNMAVGHSLGASFILYSFLKKPNLFREYMAISPNLAYDDSQLSNALIHFDYKAVTKPVYIYLSNAHEGSFEADFKPAREKVYSFFKNTLNEKNVTVEIAEFPNTSHWGTFPLALNKGLEFYFEHILEKREMELSEEKYEVKIRVKVFDKDDRIYITGNQESLGNWDPQKVEMKKVTLWEREIVLKLQSPAQFKFTKGSWDTELEILGTNNNITIKPEQNGEFVFDEVRYE
jgi:uncharacterized protein